MTFLLAKKKIIQYMNIVGEVLVLRTVIIVGSKFGVFEACVIRALHLESTGT